jgi:hypothetical protein
MWQNVTLSVGTVVLSALLSWLIASRVSRADHVADVARGAVDALLPPIAQLRALVHTAQARSVSPGEVSATTAAFEGVCLQQEAALPERVRAAPREVRTALGNYFGGPALAGVDPRLHRYPLAEPDVYWQEISVSYLDYVLRELQLSTVRRLKGRMLRFHEWRKDEDPWERDGVAAPKK